MTTPIPLRDALKASVNHPDEIELAGMLMDHATALRACGERIRQSALRGDSQHERDQRTFILADALAIARDAEQAVRAYTAGQGYRITKLDPRWTPR